MLPFHRIKVRRNALSQKLNFHFSKSFQADVWQQSLDQGQLLLTIRDAEKLEVSFSLLNLIDGTLVFEGLQFEEAWWISAYHFFDGVVVFQVYEDSQDIEAKSYFAFDLASQEAIWVMDKVQAVGRQGQFLQLRSDEAGDALFWINIQTGETYGERPEEYSSEDILQSTRFPLHYTEELSHFNTVQAFLRKQFDIQIDEACDYLEYGDLIFIAYHQRESNNLSHHLLVLDQEGNQVHQQLLDEGLQGLVSGAFFIAGEQLIFVEGRRTLKSYIIG